MPREHVGARDVRRAKKAVQVGGEPVAVLATGCRTTPSLAGSIERADAACRRGALLHPRPTRCSLAEAVEEHDSWLAGSHAVEIEAVPVDEIGSVGSWVA